MFVNLIFILLFVTDLPPGYPYQSITAPFGSPFPPYHIPTPAGENAEAVPPRRSCSPASAAPLPSAHLHPRLLDADIKPQKLEPSKTGSFLKQEPGVEQPRLAVTPEPFGPLRPSCSPVRADKDRAEDEGEALHVPSPPPQQDREVREEEKDQIKMEVSSYSCQAAYPSPPPLKEAEPKPEVTQDPDRYPPPCIAVDADSQETSRIKTSSVACEHPDAAVSSGLKESAAEPLPSSSSSSPLSLAVSPEDPMAGMFALLTASEMAQARPDTPPAPEPLPVGADCSGAGPLEMVALEGMALLSQMAQQEMENISQEQGTSSHQSALSAFSFKHPSNVSLISASRSDTGGSGLSS